MPLTSITLRGKQIFMNSYNDLIIIDIYKQKKDDPEIQKAFEIANVGSGKGILGLPAPPLAVIL